MRPFRSRMAMPSRSREAISSGMRHIVRLRTAEPANPWKPRPSGSGQYSTFPRDTPLVETFLIEEIQIQLPVYVALGDYGPPGIDRPLHLDGERVGGGDILDVGEGNGGRDLLHNGESGLGRGGEAGEDRAYG